MQSPRAHYARRVGLGGRKVPQHLRHRLRGHLEGNVFVRIFAAHTCNTECDSVQGTIIVVACFLCYLVGILILWVRKDNILVLSWTCSTPYVLLSVATLLMGRPTKFLLGVFVRVNIGSHAQYRMRSGARYDDSDDCRVFFYVVRGSISFLRRRSTSPRYLSPHECSQPKFGCPFRTFASVGFCQLVSSNCPLGHMSRYCVVLL